MIVAAVVVVATLVVMTLVVIMLVVTTGNSTDDEGAITTRDISLNCSVKPYNCNSRHDKHDAILHHSYG